MNQPTRMMGINVSVDCQTADAAARSRAIIQPINTGTPVIPGPGRQVRLLAHELQVVRRRDRVHALRDGKRARQTLRSSASTCLCGPGRVPRSPSSQSKSASCRPSISLSLPSLSLSLSATEETMVGRLCRLGGARPSSIPMCMGGAWEVH